jgi:hypothetical protein
MLVYLDGQPHHYKSEGPSHWGKEESLLDQDENLIAHAPWSQEGYTVQSFLSADQFAAIQDHIRLYVAQLLGKTGSGPARDFTLDRYHKFVENPTHHLTMVKDFQNGLDLDRLPLPADTLSQRISDICGLSLTTVNPYTHRNIFNIRLVRPGQSDFNPPHKDVWIDRLRNAVNIYAPLAGSNQNSALPVAPGTHLWKESEIKRTDTGAIKGSSTYTVPAVVATKKELRMIRPNPRENEVLVFSPYMIHGGGFNSNADTTRVSLEVRFWKKP